jgi:hypothetical protein
MGMTAWLSSLTTAAQTRLLIGSLAGLFVLVWAALLVYPVASFLGTVIAVTAGLYSLGLIAFLVTLRTVRRRPR